MEQEHSTDDSTRMKGRVLADMAMISVLVAYAQRDHPDFKEYAIHHFDRFLGRITIRDTGRDFNEMLLCARHRFHLMLSGSLDNDLLVRAADTSRKPLTLRRRLLNWLKKV